MYHRIVNIFVKSYKQETLKNFLFFVEREENLQSIRFRYKLYSNIFLSISYLLFFRIGHVYEKKKKKVTNGT